MKITDSDRLNYHLMGAEDAALLFELDQDEAVMKYINGGKLTTMKDIQEVFLPRMAQYTNSEKGWGLWQVTVSKSQQFIGWILVRPMDYFNAETQWDNWELGWRFKRKAWGQGYATEAAKHIMDELAANHPTVNKFSAIAIPENAASINIMQKLGMRYIKTDLHKDPLGDMQVAYYEYNCNN